MSTPSSNVSGRRLGDAMRRKLEVTSAMAWEALVETHVEQAGRFITAIAKHWPVEDALPRYLREMDLDETMATAIRTRVLMQFEGGAAGGSGPRETTATGGALPLQFPDAPEYDDGDQYGWNLLRRPRRVVRDVVARQRRKEQADRILQLSLARAEEYVIRTHVENAIGFVALLEDQLPLDRSVQQYISAVRLAGGRAQTVFQRTMACLADVHLPLDRG
jgi:hypothetical protein